MSQTVATFATIFFSMILVNNYVLVQFLGICPFLGVSKNAGFLRWYGRGCYCSHGDRNRCYLPAADFFGWMPTAWAICRRSSLFWSFAVLVQLIEIVLKRYVHALYQSLGVYLPLITTNCCVLGVTILAVQDYTKVYEAQGFGMAYAEALICAAGAGVGFLVAMLLFCGVRQRVERSNPPESFKGLPITLVSAAITAMSFMGFGGLVENIIAALM